MRSATLFFALLLVNGNLWAQVDTKKTVSPEDALKWEIPADVDLSRDGKWAAMILKRGDGQMRVEFRPTGRGTGWSTPGQSVTFSPDSRWVVVQAGRGVRASLVDGSNPLEWPQVTSFGFYAGGKGLTVHEASGKLHLLGASGGQTALDEVTSYAADTRSSLLAVVTKTQKGSTLTVVDGDLVRDVLTTDSSVEAASWTSQAETLLGYVDGRVVVVSGLEDDKPEVKVCPFDVLPDRKSVKFNEDGSRVIFCAASGKKNAGDATSVEVWHSTDAPTLPERRAAQGTPEARGKVYIWHVEDDKVQQLTQGDQETLFILPGSEKALVANLGPYLDPAKRNYLYWDIDIVDLEDGSRQRVFTKADNMPVPSPNGKSFAVFEDGHWWLYNMDEGTKTNLTGGLPNTFEMQSRGFGMASEMPEEQADWLADGKSLLLHDRFDAWLYRDGKMERLTRGREEGRVYRREPGPPLKSIDDLVLKVSDSKTKETGYWLRGGLVGFGPYASRYMKAEAGLITFTRSSFNEPPALYALTAADKEPKQLLATNPQHSDYAWGKTALISYKSKAGTDLQGVLIYPAKYEADKSYPMVVSVYEKQSDLLHQYMSPNYRAPYNPQTFSQNGYFVLLPDIVFETERMPGQNAVECTEAALDAVLAKIVGVDREKVGIVGHSWGGYEAAYVSTVSQRFKAAVCGSGLTDFASFAGGHTGKNQYPSSMTIEVGQGRMQVPQWDAPEAYRENSVVWKAPMRKAPLLIQVGDQDDVVDWHQGLQLHNALRQLGKESVMLVYRGEGHMLQKPENQIDFSRKVLHFMDVHLKGAQPEPWLLPKAKGE